MSNSENIYFYATLLRHGETPANAQNIIQGHMDTDLSPRGLLQAHGLKDYMNSIPIDFVISSDLMRAYKTAEALGLSAPLELDSRLRERNFGQYCGAPRRELQEFTERNAQTGGGCDGWRNVGGECSHEMAHRTSKFLIDLCSRLMQKLRDEKNIVEHDVRSPVLLESSIGLLPEPMCDRFPAESTPRYAGHVLMVSHGGWIRHFLRLVALQSEHGINFPKRCINSVMRNCGICQIGIAFDAHQFELFQTQPPCASTLCQSPLPVFGSVLEHPEQESRCPFYHLAHQRLPLFAVCYHFDVVKQDLDVYNKAKSVDGHASNNTADNLCSTMEVIFSDDGDEYSGLPDQPNL